MRAVAQFGTVATPEQFGFIMRRAVRPLIQLQIPPQLVSPAKLHKRKADRGRDIGGTRNEPDALIAISSQTGGN